jgi:hypothetical protein
MDNLPTMLKRNGQRGSVDDQLLGLLIAMREELNEGALRSGSLCNGMLPDIVQQSGSAEFSGVGTECCRLLQRRWD